MEKQNEWRDFFNGHAPDYMKNSFTSNTQFEVDFISEVLRIPESSWILDVGCGTGRHAIGLARMGYRLTGVDISSGMLKEAQAESARAGVTLELVNCDAAEYRPSRHYDGAICLCEGPFGLLGSGDNPILRDLNILKIIRSALKPSGKFLLTTLNGCRKIRQYSQEDINKGIFDPLITAEKCLMDWDTPEGKKHMLGIERGYIPSELALMFTIAGFAVEHIWGGTAGNWGKRQVDLDEMELMVVGRAV